MSLAGRGILVTRPRDLAAGFAGRIESAGGTAIVFPAIEIERLPPPRALRSLAQFDLVVFISPSSVAAALHEPEALRGVARVAAVGAGTRQALERYTGAAVLAPEKRADSEALLDLPQLARPAGWRVLIVRGEGGRAHLGDVLRDRGAHVEYAECYKRVPSSADPAPLVARWRKGEVDAVTAFSTDSYQNLVRLVGSELACSTPVFVPHERVGSAATQHGARKVLVAGPGEAEMLERLVAYFSP